MNWDRIQGNWKQMTGKLKEKWGKLTDDEFDQMARAPRPAGRQDPGALRRAEGRSRAPGEGLGIPHLADE